MKLNPFIIKALPCFYFMKLCTWGWMWWRRQMEMEKGMEKREFPPSPQNDTLSLFFSLQPQSHSHIKMTYEKFHIFDYIWLALILSALTWESCTFSTSSFFLIVTITQLQFLPSTPTPTSAHLLILKFNSLSFMKNLYCFSPFALCFTW